MWSIYNTTAQEDSPADSTERVLVQVLNYYWSSNLQRNVCLYETSFELNNSDDIIRSSSWVNISPDHSLVLVQSLLSHVLDEGQVLHLQVSRNRQQNRCRVQDVHLHLGLGAGQILLIMVCWCHLEGRTRHCHLVPNHWICYFWSFIFIQRFLPQYAWKVLTGK